MMQVIHNKSRYLTCRAFTSLLLITFSVINGVKSQNHEIEAENLIITMNTTLMPLRQKVQEHLWRVELPRRQIKSTSNPLEDYRSSQIEFCEKLKILPTENFENKTLQRQVQILSDMQLNGLPKEDYFKAKNNLKIMTQFPFNAKICSYRNITNCSISYLPDIINSIVKTRTPAELRYYWEEWRESIKSQSRSVFDEYVELYRKAASLNGHVTPSRTWYLYYEDEHFMEDITNAMEEIRPFFREFHAYVRHAIQQKYGENILTEGGPIPEHLMEQVHNHAWRHHSIFEPPFPQRHLPDVKESMIKQNYSSWKIVQMAEEFYTSLGIEKLPSSFWVDHLQMIPEDFAGIDCKSRVYELYPDVGLRYCPKYDFKKFVQMHGTFAVIYYHLYKNNQPIGFDKEAFPGFGSIIGEACILSASSPRHLEAVDLIENYSLDTELTLNRLFRLGIHTFVSIPIYYVNEKFWVDALDQRIKSEDYNCGYWQLMQDFAGIEPPVYRTEQNFDPGYKFYQGIDDNKPNTVKLLGEIMGYQIYRGLCLKTGNYIPGDPTYPLHNCDFYKNEKAGEILREMFSLGASKNWREILKIATDETKLSAKALLEFYEPLYNWLKEQNLKNGVTPGWENSEKCEKE